MADRPIIFSAPMIRALLEGRKSQTRRVMKEQRHVATPALMGDRWQWRGYSGAALGDANVPCAIGDRLWVREAHALVPASAYRCSEGVEQAINPGDNDRAAIYRAGFDRSTSGIRWRPSIHMPRWASRLTLIVTDVRVQRLQEISEGDAKAEGAVPMAMDDEGKFYLRESCQGGTYLCGFAGIWAHIHGPDAWDANPWVCAITFDVKRGHIDRISADD